jgi:hypothetical protein
LGGICKEDGGLFFVECPGGSRKEPVLEKIIQDYVLPGP